MIKIILFIFRLHLFFISYFIYCLNILCLILNFKKISKNIFVLSAYLCSLALGIKYKINKQSKIFLLKDCIHIVNHDSPLDIFIAQCFFRIPTITTVNNHLNKILPFFKDALINFGHFNFDHLDFNERRHAYNFLLQKSKNQEMREQKLALRQLMTHMQLKQLEWLQKMYVRSNLILHLEIIS